jgi:signal transduction histidine kinase
VRALISGRFAPAALIALLAVTAVVRVLHELAAGHAGHAVLAALITSLVLVLLLRYMRLSATRLADSGHREREVALRTATLEASRTGFCVYRADGSVEYRNPAWLGLVSPNFEVPPGGGLVHTTAGRALAFASTRLAGGELVVSVDDVTVQERERATRDRFLAEVVRAQDLEARRIAELLHDDAVQRLTALGMRLELTALRSGEEALRELASEAGAVTGAIRRLLVDLHPVVLESQGISAAVDGAAESLRAHGVEVDVEPFALRLVPEHEHLAYRLVQEALANVLSHAEASYVEVSFAIDGARFRCLVDDDGRGFEVSAVEHAVANGSLGLNLVRERIELAGGSFSIKARDGGGTSFSFELPLRQRELEEAAA